MIALINPNTSAATTTQMVRIARDSTGPGVQITGLTAPFGAPLITEPTTLARAAEAVCALAPELASAQAVIIAAFGDPGLAALRARLSVPVTGIAEAGMAEAAQHGSRFAVVTTTPALRGHIAAAALRNGHDRFLGTWITHGDPVRVTQDPTTLRPALEAACIEAIAAGAEAIVIGGGPLAEAARSLAATCPVPLIEPVPAAVRLSLARCAEGALT